jgi:hypothetical protein
VVEDVGASGGLREEVERLRRDLSEAREQQAATSGVLAVLGRATSDLDAVLETVVDSARHLCRADIALIFLLEGDAYRLAIASGARTEEDRAYLDQHPLAQDRSTLAGQYGEADVARVLQIKQLRERGVRIGEAIQVVSESATDILPDDPPAVGDPAPPPPTEPGPHR